MHKLRLNLRKLLLVIIVSLQALVIFAYIFHNDGNSTTKKENMTMVSFITEKPKYFKRKTNTPGFYPGTEYYQKLDYISTETLYKDFNSTICYKSGTDINVMQHLGTNNWICECLPGYHGIDCGQPEVIWRALLTQRKLRIQEIKPRKRLRQLIYIMEFNTVTMTIVDIRLSELAKTVDLFILYNFDETNELKQQLDYGFLKAFHKKVIYLNTTRQKLWSKLKHFLFSTFSKEDLVLFSNYQEIPNVSALEFFKVHDNFPESINFRIRWSVFGFFWTHPNKTVLRSGLFSIKYLMKTAMDLKQLQNVPSAKFTVGDLNHFGGWYCEFCNAPEKIILELQERNLSQVFSGTKTLIDVAFIEDLIERGMYLDSKTLLNKMHRYNDNYFAPKILLDNLWKYDYLMMNIYSKMDYYEQ